MKLHKDYLVVLFFLAFLVFANVISLSSWGNSLDMLRPAPFIIDLAVVVIVTGMYVNLRRRTEIVNPRKIYACWLAHELKYITDRLYHEGNCFRGLQAMRGLIDTLDKESQYELSKQRKQIDSYLTTNTYKKCDVYLLFSDIVKYLMMGFDFNRYRNTRVIFTKTAFEGMNKGE